MSNVIPLHAPAPVERPPVQGIVNMAELAGRQAPAREWLVPNLIPAGKVVLFTGDGGLGKSLLMQQLLTAVATGRQWLGFDVPTGPAFGFFCEDDQNELFRRQADINSAMMLEFEDLYRLDVLSGVGRDCTLMAFSGDGPGKLTRTFEIITEQLRRRRPTVVVIDTLADTFGGNEIIRNQVRAFINACLGRIAQEIGCTVILCGHPSRAGRETGEGTSGSTAWNNSVRARLYLDRPSDFDADERILSSKKQNYGPSAGELRLQWHQGAFRVVDNQIAVPPEVAKNAAEMAFLKGMAVMVNLGKKVIPARNQGNYAPKQMKQLPECRGFKVEALEKAMEQLLRLTVIRIETPKRGGQYLAFTDPAMMTRLLEEYEHPEQPFPE